MTSELFNFFVDRTVEPSMESLRSSLSLWNVHKLIQRFYVHFSEFAIKSGLIKVVKRFAFEIALNENLNGELYPRFPVLEAYVTNGTETFYREDERGEAEINLNFISAREYQRADEF